MTAMKIAPKTHYETLGLTRAATEKEIKQAYRKLALKYHPDKNKDNPDATRKFQEISEAYTLLSNVAERKIYDSTLDNPFIDKPVGFKSGGFKSGGFKSGGFKSGGFKSGGFDFGGFDFGGFDFGGFNFGGFQPPKQTQNQAEKIRQSEQRFSAKGLKNFYAFAKSNPSFYPNDILIIPTSLVSFFDEPKFMAFITAHPIHVLSFIETPPENITALLSANWSEVELSEKNIQELIGRHISVALIKFVLQTPYIQKALNNKTLSSYELRRFYDKDPGLFSKYHIKNIENKRYRLSELAYMNPEIRGLVTTPAILKGLKEKVLSSAGIKFLYYPLSDKALKEAIEKLTKLNSPHYVTNLCFLKKQKISSVANCLLTTFSEEISQHYQLDLLLDKIILSKENYTGRANAANDALAKSLIKHYETFLEEDSAKGLIDFVNNCTKDINAMHAAKPYFYSNCLQPVLDLLSALVSIVTLFIPNIVTQRFRLFDTQGTIRQNTNEFSKVLEPLKKLHTELESFIEQENTHSAAPG